MFPMANVAATTGCPPYYQDSIGLAELKAENDQLILYCQETEQKIQLLEAEVLRFKYDNDRKTQDYVEVTGAYADLKAELDEARTRLNATQNVLEHAYETMYRTLLSSRQLQERLAILTSRTEEKYNALKTEAFEALKFVFGLLNSREKAERLKRLESGSVLKKILLELPRQSVDAMKVDVGSTTTAPFQAAASDRKKLQQSQQQQQPCQGSHNMVETRDITSTVTTASVPKTPSLEKTQSQVLRLRKEVSSERPQSARKKTVSSTNPEELDSLQRLNNTRNCASLTNDHSNTTYSALLAYEPLTCRTTNDLRTLLESIRQELHRRDEQLCVASCGTSHEGRSMTKAAHSTEEPTPEQRHSTEKKPTLANWPVQAPGIQLAWLLASPSTQLRHIADAANLSITQQASRSNKSFILPRRGHRLDSQASGISLPARERRSIKNMSRTRQKRDASKVPSAFANPDIAVVRQFFKDVHETQECAGNTKVKASETNSVPIANDRTCPERSETASHSDTQEQHAITLRSDTTGQLRKHTSSPIQETPNMSRETTENRQHSASGRSIEGAVYRYTTCPYVPGQGESAGAASANISDTLSASPLNSKLLTSLSPQDVPHLTPAAEPRKGSSGAEVNIPTFPKQPIESGSQYIRRGFPAGTAGSMHRHTPQSRSPKTAFHLPDMSIKPHAYDVGPLCPPYPPQLQQVNDSQRSNVDFRQRTVINLPTSSLLAEAPPLEYPLTSSRRLLPSSKINVNNMNKQILNIGNEPQYLGSSISVLTQLPQRLPTASLNMAGGGLSNHGMSFLHRHRFDGTQKDNSAPTTHEEKTSKESVSKLLHTCSPLVSQPLADSHGSILTKVIAMSPGLQEKASISPTNTPRTVRPNEQRRSLSLGEGNGVVSSRKGTQCLTTQNTRIASRPNGFVGRNSIMPIMPESKGHK